MIEGSMNQNHKIYPYQEKIKTYAEIERIVASLKREGKKIVMVSGCYDIVHLGHVRFLMDAKQKGEVLIVSVGSDKNIKQIKGPERPVMSQEYRASMLASLTPVDYVVIDEEPITLPDRVNFLQLLSLVRPHYFAVNNNDRSIEAKRILVAKFNASLRIVDVTLSAITSTTKILDILNGL